MSPLSEEHRSQPQIPSSLDVFLLGTVDLGSSIELQEQLRNEIDGRTDGHGSILVCEHPLSVTIGLEGSFADVLIEREELDWREMEVRWLNRSGRTFVHLPGQLSVYVAIPLDRQNLGIGDFQTSLENSLIAMAAELKVTAEPGLIVPGASCRCGQFAFMGLEVRDGVALASLHVNVSLPQESLQIIRWSDRDLRVTSLASQRARPTAMSTVRESLIRNLAKSLCYEGYHVYTGHPLLRRSIRKVYVYV